MFNRFKCYWLGHDYDKEKYRSDLTYHMSFDRMKEFAECNAPIEEVHKFIDNPPKPYCKSCHEEIEIIE